MAMRNILFHALMRFIGISAVIHVASPFTGVVQDPKKDMLDPAIEGTLNVIRATHKAGIQRIIITSSFVAVFDFAYGGAVQ
jgi:nucleoside-diphosphate-sugar epimerase